MSGLSNKRRTGEVARAKVLEYFRGRETPHNTDHFLTWLQGEGFAVTPLDPQPARRGNSKPPVYTGPDLIGKTHVGRLAQ